MSATAKETIKMQEIRQDLKQRMKEANKKGDHEAVKKYTARIKKLTEKIDSYSPKNHKLRTLRDK